MTTKEMQMVALLRTMKEQNGLCGVKGEFEAEGATFDELLRLREIARQANVPMAVKVGGCEAITDIRMARTLGADAVIAPMIESAFAAKKFISAMHTVFGDESAEKPTALINVETRDGVRNLDSILSLNEVSALGGLDVGRVDIL